MMPESRILSYRNSKVGEQEANYQDMPFPYMQNFLQVGQQKILMVAQLAVFVEPHDGKHQNLAPEQPPASYLYPKN